MRAHTYTQTHSQCITAPLSSHSAFLPQQGIPDFPSSAQSWGGKQQLVLLPGRMSCPKKERVSGGGGVKSVHWIILWQKSGPPAVVIFPPVSFLFPGIWQHLSLSFSLSLIHSHTHTHTDEPFGASCPLWCNNRVTSKPSGHLGNKDFFSLNPWEHNPYIILSHCFEIALKNMRTGNLQNPIYPVTIIKRLLSTLMLTLSVQHTV